MLFQDITTQFSDHLLENLIFSHFSPYVPAYGYPYDPISAFIDKNAINGCCCNEIWKEKATAGYYHPIFPTVAWEFNFWPFFTICNCSWATPWSHLCFYWQNYYHWVLFQWYLRRESNSRLLQPNFFAICLKFNFWPFLAIFHHLCLLMGDPLIPLLLLLTKTLSLSAVKMKSTERKLLQVITTLFITFNFWPFLAIFHHLCLLMDDPLIPPLLFDKNVITRCCCNEIYRKKAAPCHYNPSFLPYA